MADRCGFYTEDTQESWGPHYKIWMKHEGKLHPGLEEGKTTFAGFGYAPERDKYFAEFTDDELNQCAALMKEAFAAVDKSQRIRLFNKLDRLKDAVQKRAGIKNT